MTAIEIVGVVLTGVLGGFGITGLVVSVASIWDY